MINGLKYSLIQTPLKLKDSMRILNYPCSVIKTNAKHSQKLDFDLKFIRSLELCRKDSIFSLEV